MGDNPVVHEGIKCFSCQMVHIRGQRYKCLICVNINLCGVCYKAKGAFSNSTHKNYHPMQEIFIQTANAANKFTLDPKKLPDNCLICPFCNLAKLNLSTLHEHTDQVHYDSDDYLFLIDLILRQKLAFKIQERRERRERRKRFIGNNPEQIRVQTQGYNRFQNAIQLNDNAPGTSPMSRYYDYVSQRNTFGRYTFYQDILPPRSMRNAGAPLLTPSSPSRQYIRDAPNRVSSTLGNLPSLRPIINSRSALAASPAPNNFGTLVNENHRIHQRLSDQLRELEAHASNIPITIDPINTAQIGMELRQFVRNVLGRELRDDPAKTSNVSEKLEECPEAAVEKEDSTGDEKHDLLLDRIKVPVESGKTQILNGKEIERRQNFIDAILCSMLSSSSLSIDTSTKKPIASKKSKLKGKRNAKKSGGATSKPKLEIDEQDSPFGKDIQVEMPEGVKEMRTFINRLHAHKDESKKQIDQPEFVSAMYMKCDESDTDEDDESDISDDYYSYESDDDDSDASDESDEDDDDDENEEDKAMLDFVRGKTTTLPQPKGEDDDSLSEGDFYRTIIEDYKDI